MFVVFGATGRAGGEVARALLDQGKTVRVAVRQPAKADVWRKAGAEVVAADMSRAEDVAAALTGATAAFLLNPPPVSGDPAAATAVIGQALREGVQRAGLQQAVVLSSVGAQHADGTGVIATLHQLEKALTGAVPALTFLRAGYFVETWGEVADAAITQGVLPTFLAPELKIPMVSTRDIGLAASHLLQDDWRGERIVELSGPQDWSASDVARAFSQALGRPIEPAFAAPEDRAAILKAEGVPDEVAVELLGMYDGLANGRVAREAGNQMLRGETDLLDAVKRIVSDDKAERHAA